MGRHTFLLEKACGGCTECCRGPLDVPELEITQGHPCKHLCKSGCGFYENRPEVCRVFSCVWKTNLVPEKYRPDRSKAICKWVDEDGVLLLVPTQQAVIKNRTAGRETRTFKLSYLVVEYWKGFAKRTGQELRLWDGEKESALVSGQS